MPPATRVHATHRQTRNSGRLEQRTKASFCVVKHTRSGLAKRAQTRERFRAPRQRAPPVASAAPAAIMSLSALLRQSGDAAAALASSAQASGERARSADPPTLRHAPSLNDFSLGFGAELHAQDGACLIAARARGCRCLAPITAHCFPLGAAARARARYRRHAVQQPALTRCPCPPRGARRASGVRRSVKTARRCLVAAPRLCARVHAPVSAQGVARLRGHLQQRASRGAGARAGRRQGARRQRRSGSIFRACRARCARVPAPRLLPAARPGRLERPLRGAVRGEQAGTAAAPFAPFALRGR